jgi:hypothetical protein
MQTVSLKLNDMDTLLAFIMEVGRQPQRVGKSFPELSWRALNKLDAVAADLEAAEKPLKEFFKGLQADFDTKFGDLKTQIEKADPEERVKLQAKLAEEVKKFREEKTVDAKDKELIVLELADDKFDMIKKALDDHAIELFVRREPLDVLLPAFGLKE